MGSSARTAASVWCALVARMIVSHVPSASAACEGGHANRELGDRPRDAEPDRLMAATCSSTMSTTVIS